MTCNSPTSWPRLPAAVLLFCVTTGMPLVGQEALPKDGSAAPDFASLDRAGAEVRLADHRGKVVVLDFWATWCGPCKAALPHVQDLATKYRDQGVVVIASCTSDARGAFDKWLQQNQAD